MAAGLLHVESQATAAAKLLADATAATFNAQSCHDVPAGQGGQLLLARWHCLGPVLLLLLPCLLLSGSSPLACFGLPCSPQIEKDLLKALELRKVRGS